MSHLHALNSEMLAAWGSPPTPPLCSWPVHPQPPPCPRSASQPRWPLRSQSKVESSHLPIEKPCHTFLLQLV